MSQFLYPNADIDADTWLADGGGSLYDKLNEGSPPSDADFIYTLTEGTAKVALSAGTDPSSSSGHVVRYRAAGDGATDLVVSLMDVSTSPPTQVAQWTESTAAQATTTYEHTLSGTEADAILDYTALELWFEASIPSSGIAHLDNDAFGIGGAFTTGHTLAFPNDVTAGSLLSIVLYTPGQFASTPDASAITKSSGTATIGTVTLESVEEQSQGGDLKSVAIFSVVVTGGGSLTIAGTYDGNVIYPSLSMAEFSGDWSDRIDDSAITAYDVTTVNTTDFTFGSGDGTSTGAGLFIGAAIHDNRGNTAITPDAAYTSITNDQVIDAGYHGAAEHTYQIVEGATTDSADWDVTSDAANMYYWIAAQAVYK